MFRLPALAGVLALLFATAPTAAKPAYDNRGNERAAHKAMLRETIRYHRFHTWSWQDRAGVERWPTRHLERTASLDFLRTIARLWHQRHREAMRSFKAERSRTLSQSTSVDSCLAKLIEREGSGGDPHATNPDTGAYGLPQALPGDKMASAGADWRDNPATQIRWMIGYVNGRYGGSCAALAHSYAYGWY